MPRRNRPERHVIPPDARFGNIQLQMFINKLMKRGKKSVAERVVYGALQRVQEQAGRDPVDVFSQAIRNATPVLEVKPRRVGGATYQVPVEIRPDRRLAQAEVVPVQERAGSVHQTISRFCFWQPRSTGFPTLR